MSPAVTHPRFPARRGAVRASSWWGRAWVRAVEEAAYGEEELRGARRHARSGAVSGLTVTAGSVIAAVDEGDDTWSVQVTVPVLAPGDVEMFGELVAAESGRVAALLAGELPHALVEECEEAGVELLPYGGELEATCTCTAWMQPCAHALAVMYQLGWLFDADPFVLLAVRGADRDQLLGAVHARADGGATDPAAHTPLLAVDLEVAREAMVEAAALLDQIDTTDDVHDPG